MPLAGTLLVEHRPGIPFARNRGVAKSLELADLIAFVDDDETVDERWLCDLRDALLLTDADVVKGRVVSVFERPPPAWMVRGDCFQRPQQATGAPLRTAATNNALVRSTVFATREAWFSEDMALTGGSDGEFFSRVAREGFRIVSSYDAVVYERVRQQRVHASWLLRRAFRRGQNDLLKARLRGESRPARFRLAAAGIIRCVVGAVRAAAVLPAGRHRAIRRLMPATRGLGCAAAALGLRYEEYRRLGVERSVMPERALWSGARKARPGPG